MWAVIGGFIGKTLHVYFFYKKNPGLPGLISAPWYAELTVPLIITIAIVAVLVFIRLIIREKDKG